MQRRSTTVGLLLLLVHALDASSHLPQLPAVNAGRSIPSHVLQPLPAFPDQQVDAALDEAATYFRALPSTARNNTRFYRKHVRREVHELTAHAQIYARAADKLVELYNLSRPTAETLLDIRAAPRPEFNANTLCQTPSFSCVTNSKYRTQDGSCNNLANPRWGMAIIPMERLLRPQYADGVQTLRRSVTGTDLPNPRVVSLLVHPDQDRAHPQLTSMTMAFGQFLDHDITSTPEAVSTNCCQNPSQTDCLPIPLPPDDPFYQQFNVRCLEFGRSIRACGSSPREQINQVSSYIDGSMIYGSSTQENNNLRSFQSGQLVGSAGDRLSQDRGNANCGNPQRGFFCFRAGDARVNENPGLAAVQTIWHREHNRVAGLLRNANPNLNDNVLHQEARRIVVAELQNIVYTEFLPVVLGQDIVSQFRIALPTGTTTYEPSINAGTINEFATAAFRFGHSIIQNTFLLPGSTTLSLVTNFDNPESLYTQSNIERLAFGLTQQTSQSFDNFLVEAVTDHLFQRPGVNFGSDLASLNIQRGREHGLPPYNEFRQLCGLPRAASFDDLNTIFRDTETVNRHRQVYRNVNDIDLWVGGLSERPVNGGVVGPTLGCIIAAQFNRLLYGDRYFFTHANQAGAFNSAQLQNLRSRTYSSVLCDNSPGINELQANVFLKAGTGNTVTACPNQPKLNAALFRV